MWPSVRAQAEDTCLPVAGNWTWTPDEVIRNEALDRSLLSNPDVRSVPLVTGPYRTKYVNCLHWTTDHEAYILGELLDAHEGMTATKTLFDTTVAIPVSYLTKGVTGLAARLGLGSLISTTSTKLLDEYIFGEADEEFNSAVANLYLQLKSTHKDETTGQIHQRLTDKLRAWGRDPTTLRWLDDTVTKALIRQDAERLNPLSANAAEATAKAKVSKVDKAFRDHKAITKQIIGEARQVAEQADEEARQAAAATRTDGAVAPPTNWALLNKKYDDLRDQLGNDADKKIKAAANDGELRDKLQLSERDVKDLVAGFERRDSLRRGSDQAQQLAKDAKQLAALSMNLGWQEGARVFVELSQAASGYGNLLQALAGAALGPPGPLQMVSAANAVFAIGGSLSRVFGGVKQEDGLANALKQIFAALRSISDQLRDLRMEQRDNFEYARRNLEVLVELAASNALKGVESCRRTDFLFGDWMSRTGGTDFRLALASAEADPGLELRARDCYRWIHGAAMLPFNAYGINVLYKQRLAGVTEMAARYPQQSVEFANRGFILAEETFPALRTLLDSDDTTVLLYDRQRLAEPNRPTPDLGERMHRAGHEIGRDWKLSHYLDQMLNSAAVATVVESALVMKPAAAMLDGAATIDDADRAFGRYASIERELYALVLIALAQERLMAGIHVAENIDLLLAEHDRWAQAERMRQCLSSPIPNGTGRAGCVIDTGLPFDTDPTPCPLVRDPHGKTLCARWGRTVFDSKAAAAVAALKAFPTLRQNVLNARLWRLGRRAGLARDWVPRYRLAWGLGTSPDTPGTDAGALALEKIFAGLQLTKLGKEEVVDKQNDAFVQSGVYFVRLAGDCDGLRQRVLLQVASCDGVRCSHNIGKDEQGRSHILNSDGKPIDMIPDRKQACVMAPLPTPDVFQAGALEKSVAVRRLEELAAHLSMSIAFDRVFQAAGNDDRATLLRNFRPAFPAQPLRDKLE
jgi:hypothetical protein